MIEFIEKIKQAYLNKLVRLSICAMTFITMVMIGGVSVREAQRYMYMFLCFIIFSFLLENVYWTLFMIWTTYLFLMFKFQGGVYLESVFFACVMFYIIKKFFKIEYIETFFKAFLAMMFVNMLYMVVQSWGYEFIFATESFKNGIRRLHLNQNLFGFFGIESSMGMMFALAAPVCLYFKNKGMKIAGVLMLGFVLMSKSSLNVVSCIVGILFSLYFQIPKKMWVSILIGLVGLGTFYTTKIDQPNKERLSQWQASMVDYMLHPITGWGLDSFKNQTEKKQHLMAEVFKFENKKTLILYWDNPHSLYISLLYEWGLFGLLIVLSYYYYIIKRFIRSVKTPLLVAVTGCILVFILLSTAHFPIFMARFAVIIIPMLAFFDILTKKKEDTYV